MKIPQNTFRDALRAGRPQIGCWVGFASPDVAEALAGCGFDWLLIDGEHAPNDPRTALEQLRAIAPYAQTHAVVRAVEANVALVKQYLDIGAQTLLIPMIDTAEQAALMVQAMRYPPEGIRGMGAALRAAVGSDSPLFGETRGRIVEAIGVLLDAGQRDGSVRPDVSAEDVMCAMSAVWMVPSGDGWAVQVRKLLDLVVDGLRFGAPSSV